MSLVGATVACSSDDTGRTADGSGAVASSPSVAAAPATSAEPAPVRLCDTFASTTTQGGTYRVQTNVWGASTPQCIAVSDSGFAVTAAEHDQPRGAEPAAYPSVFRGCHHGHCTRASGLPRQVSTLGSVTSAVTITDPGTGQWNAAYDLWLDPAPRTDGKNTGAELMIWIDHHDRPRAAGTRRGTATIAGATWSVWTRDPGWNVVAYVREDPTTSFSGDLTEFIDDAVERGAVERSWFLTSVQFGFELWRGGAGLEVTSFSTTVG